jgi:hypothetical protein
VAQIFELLQVLAALLVQNDDLIDRRFRLIMRSSITLSLR